MIEYFMSWNNYPISIRNFLIENVKPNMKTTPHLPAMPILRLMKTLRKFGSEYLISETPARI